MSKRQQRRIRTEEALITAVRTLIVREGMDALGVNVREVSTSSSRVGICSSAAFNYLTARGELKLFGDLDIESEEGWEEIFEVVERAAAAMLSS